MLCMWETKVSVVSVGREGEAVKTEVSEGCQVIQRLMLREGKKTGLGRGANSAVLKAQEGFS